MTLFWHDPVQRFVWPHLLFLVHPNILYTPCILLTIVHTCCIPKKFSLFLYQTVFWERLRRKIRPKPKEVSTKSLRMIPLLKNRLVTLFQHPVKLLIVSRKNVSLKRAMTESMFFDRLQLLRQELGSPSAQHIREPSSKIQMKAVNSSSSEGGIVGSRFQRQVVHDMLDFEVSTRGSNFHCLAFTIDPNALAILLWFVDM